VDSIKKKIGQDVRTINEIAAASREHAAHACAVDNNAYYPTHDRKFSRPLTGDCETGLVNNRTNRIFNGRTGSRCGSSIKSFLLQTYQPDTDEVVRTWQRRLMSAAGAGAGLASVIAQVRRPPAQCEVRLALRGRTHRCIM
jgi:hypothetical protein